MEKYIHSFIDAAISVFKDLLHVTIKTEKLFFAEESYPHNWDISGVITLSGEAAGSVVLSMKKETALEITGILTGKTHSEIDEDVIDAVGEMSNIIAGNAKRQLEAMFRLTISLPTVVTGPNHKLILHNEKTRIVCINFSIFSGETICLSVIVVKNEAEKPC